MKPASEVLDELRNVVVDYPNFPKPGVLFKDIFPLFLKPKLLHDVVTLMANYITINEGQIDVIAGIESRGFLFGVPLSLHLNVPFVPIRKKGKLPGQTENTTIELEYGEDTIEIQKNVIKKGQKVVIMDDLLATGGTLNGSCKLIEKVGGTVSLCLVAIELLALKGRNKIHNPVYSLLKYP